MDASEDTGNTFRRTLRQRFPLVDGHPDVAGVLRQPALLAGLGPALVEPFRTSGITHVIAPEARGPILGALAAVELGAGLLLVRKVERNHPGADIHITSAPTWRGSYEGFQARSFDLSAADVVLIVDDWITTGATIDAIASVVLDCRASVAGVAAMVNKASAKTLERMAPHTLVDFAELVPQSRASRMQS